MSSEKAKTLLVAVCTRARPKMLAACLASLSRLNIPSPLDASAIVIENNDKPDSYPVVEEARKHTSLKIHYVLEPTLGIACARNRALQQARTLGVDYLAFIDDDETAEPNWLAALLEVALTQEADAVQGQVEYLLPPEDKWLKFKPDKKVGRRRDGKILNSAATNNILISRRVLMLDDATFSFDPALRYSGGEDTDFFDRLKNAGGKIVYAANALVQETVPRERCRLSSILQREMRTKVNSVIIDRKNFGDGPAFRYHSKKALSEILQGPAYLLLGLLASPFGEQRFKPILLKGLLKVAALYGRLRGYQGRTVSPYLKIEGS